uniref:Uncharacterized protein n=1 Tax=Heterorhabditis bacteriophora TaxID=37862 RepID=A0A1I7WPG5_HETBA
MAYYRATWLPTNGQFSLACDHSQNRSTRTTNFVEEFHSKIRASYPTGTPSLDEMLKFCAAELTMAKTLAISFGNGPLKNHYIRSSDKIIVFRIMSKKFTVNGYDLWVDENNFENVCELFKENVTVDDLEKWETERELKIYDAHSFIEHAKKYHSEVPPDLVQTAAKLWFSAIYVLKKFYLDIDMHLTSHSAMKYFVKLACKFHPDPAEFYEAWQTAEKLHSYSYGNKRFSDKEFPDLIAQIEWFVGEFANIPKDKIRQKMSLDFKSIPGVNYVYEKNAKTELSGITYNFNFLFSLIELLIKYLKCF